MVESHDLVRRRASYVAYIMTEVSLCKVALNVLLHAAASKLSQRNHRLWHEYTEIM